jgi:hypothetical protein
MEEITNHRKQKAITVNNKEMPEISTENCIEGKFGVHLKQPFCQFHFAPPADARNDLAVECRYKAPSEALRTMSQTASHLDQSHERPNSTLHDLTPPLVAHCWPSSFFQINSACRLGKPICKLHCVRKVTVHLGYGT